jgi:hypothetical protein
MMNALEAWLRSDPRSWKWVHVGLYGKEFLVSLEERGAGRVEGKGATLDGAIREALAKIPEASKARSDE